MATDQTLDKRGSADPVGGVADILTVMEEGNDPIMIARLTETRRKRDEAIMCLRLIAGLDPRMRDQAEATIELLAKIPFPADKGH